MDYPYAVGSLPANPVNATCEAVDAKDGDTLLRALGEVVGWFYDIGDTESGCFDAASSAQVRGGVPGDGPSNRSSWGYQSCTET